MKYRREKVEAGTNWFADFLQIRWEKDIPFAAEFLPLSIEDAAPGASAVSSQTSL
jgi:hypothetical protein